MKERIKNVMHYKKPAFWLLALAITACVAAAVCLLTDPRETVAEDAYWRLEIDDYVVALVDKEPEEGRKLPSSEEELEIRVYRDKKQWSLRSFAYDNAAVSAEEAAAYIMGEHVADILGHEGFRILYHYAPGRMGEAVFCEVDYYTVADAPVHLAQSWGDSQTFDENIFAVDLDGDERQELICNVQWADGAEDALIYRSDGVKVYRCAGTDVMTEADKNVPYYGGSRYLPDTGRILGWYWDETGEDFVEKEYEIVPDALTMWEYE